MSILIKAGWNQKVGRDPFGSEGTFVEFEIEVDDIYLQADKKRDLLEQVKTLQMLAKNAVETELAAATEKSREIAELAREEAEERDTTRRADDERDRRETGRRDAPAATERRREPAVREADWDDEKRELRERPESQRERPRERERESTSRGHDRASDRRRSWGGGGSRGNKDWRDGGTPNNSSLYGFIQDWDKDAPEGETPTKDWFKAFAKSEGIKGMFKEWSDADVRWAVEEWRKEVFGVPARSNGAAY